MVVLLVCAVGWGDQPAESVKASFSSGETTVEPIKTGMKWFINRTYRLRDLPDELNGMQVTRRNGKSGGDLTLDVPGGMTVYLIIDSDKGGNAAEDGLADLHQFLVESQWARLPEEAEFGPPAKNFFLTIYKKTFSKPAHVELHSAGFNGISVVASTLTARGVATTQPDETSAILFGGQGTLVHVASTQASVHFLAVSRPASGKMSAAVLDYSVTATVADHDGPSYFRFSPPASSDEHAALDGALRALGQRYSNFDAVSFDFSLHPQLRGDADPAIGLPSMVLLRSIVEGFAIDQGVAVAGNVEVDGKVGGPGAVGVRLKAAVSDKKCQLVLLPEENYEELLDFKIYNGLHSVLGPGVVGFSNDDEAVDWARTDRREQLSRAMEICGSVCRRISDSNGAIGSDEVIGELHEVLELAPSHLTARLLLALAQNKARQRLSIAASEYYILSGAGDFVGDFFAADATAATQPSGHNTDDDELRLLRKVRPITDLKIQLLVDAWSEFIQMQVAFNRGRASFDLYRAKRQALHAAMEKQKIDHAAAEKILTGEGV
jgi:hypothetical protein